MRHQQGGGPLVWTLCSIAWQRDTLQYAATRFSRSYQPEARQSSLQCTQPDIFVTRCATCVGRRGKGKHHSAMHVDTPTLLYISAAKISATPMSTTLDAGAARRHTCRKFMGLPYRTRSSWTAPANAFQESVGTMAAPSLQDHSLIESEFRGASQPLGALQQQISTDTIHRFSC